MADFDPAPKYKYSPDGKTVTWVNRDHMPKVAAQAGDEPMLPHHPEPHTHTWSALEAEAIRKYGAACRAAGAAQVSPRATADVERVATECMEALAIGYVEFDEDLDENVCADCSTPTGSEWGDHTPDCLVIRARAAIATTKPGA